MPEWRDYQQLVLEELKRHNEGIEKMGKVTTELAISLAVAGESASSTRKVVDEFRKDFTTKITEVQQELVKLRDGLAAAREDTGKEISALKVKSGIWGAVGGLFTTVAGILIYFFRKG